MGVKLILTFETVGLFFEKTYIKIQYNLDLLVSLVQTDVGHIKSMVLHRIRTKK